MLDFSSAEPDSHTQLDPEVRSSTSDGIHSITSSRSHISPLTAAGASIQTTSSVVPRNLLTSIPQAWLPLQVTVGMLFIFVERVVFHAVVPV